MMKKALLIFLLLCAALCLTSDGWAQACRTSDITTPTSTGATKAAVGAHVNVYASTDASNASPLTLYTDATLAAVKAQPLTTDSHGEYTYCLKSPQTVKECVSGASISTRCSTPITVGGAVEANPLDFPGSDIGAQINTALSYGFKRIRIPAGAWSYSTTINMTAVDQSLTGAGQQQTVLTYTGTGDGISWRLASFSTVMAGTVKGLTIKGTSVGRSGIHVGDIINPKIEDVVLRDFTTGYCLWQDNINDFTERWTWTNLHLDNCAIDWNITNSSGLSDANHTSMAYGYGDVMMNQWGGQIGIQSGLNTLLYNGTIRTRGNQTGAANTWLKLLAGATWWYDRLELFGEGSGTALNIDPGANFKVYGIRNLQGGMSDAGWVGTPSYAASNRWLGQQIKVSPDMGTVASWHSSGIQAFPMAIGISDIDTPFGLYHFTGANLESSADIMLDSAGNAFTWRKMSAGTAPGNSTEVASVDKDGNATFKTVTTSPSGTLNTGLNAQLHNGKQLLTFTATQSPAAVTANTCLGQLFTVSGIQVGDIIINSSPKPTHQAGLSEPNVFVNGANQVNQLFCNNTAASITPTASETYTYIVLR